MSTIALNRPALNHPALNHVSPDTEVDLVSSGELAQILQLFFSPVQQNNSQGAPQLREIEDALEAPGRTIFLYGDRTAGDTLAQILAAHRSPCNGRNEKTAFVIDEFDELANEVERARFVDFIDQIGERKLPIRFVLCGVSEALTKLLRSHESCYDSIDFTWQGSGAKTEDEAEPLEAPGRRLGQHSPHHVHLLSERLFWEMFNDPTFARSLT
jgi:hypothetical protein